MPLRFCLNSVSSFLYHQQWQENIDGDDRHDQSADGAGGQWEPEALFLGADQERDETKHCGYNGEEDGDDLRVPGLQVGFE